jgi:DNA-binding response OmpR family regulator
MRVLVVEDEALVAMAIEDELLDRGWSVVHVTTAASAMQALASQRFDAAVVDLGLPDMWGEDLIHWMRRRAPDLGVVVCSGYGGDHQPLAADTADVVRVAKPWEHGDVGRAVSAAMSAVLMPLR